MFERTCPRITPDQPAGMPKWDRTPYSIVLSQDEVVHLLFTSAGRLERGGCIDDDCETCNGFRACWWDLYNALERQRKLVLAQVLQKAGYALPDAPWEDMN